MIVVCHKDDYFEKTPIEKQRVCCNCRNRVTLEDEGTPITNIEKLAKELVSKCMIDGHYIGYVQCFTNWCIHWAKMKGGK